MRKFFRPLLASTCSPTTFLFRRLWDLGQCSCTGTHDARDTRTHTERNASASARQRQVGRSCHPPDDVARGYYPQTWPCVAPSLASRPRRTGEGRSVVRWTYAPRPSSSCPSRPRKRRRPARRHPKTVSLSLGLREGSWGTHIGLQVLLFHAERHTPASGNPTLVTLVVKLVEL